MSTNGGEPTFLDRARALLGDTQSELAAITERRQAIVQEREEAIDRVRSEFGEKLREIDRELVTLRRLEKALDPDAKIGTAGRPKKDEGKPRAWTPSEAAQDQILRALAEGSETVTATAGVIEASNTTAHYGIDALRERGLVRLAGTTGGRANARRYKLTASGRERVAELNGAEVS